MRYALQMHYTQRTCTDARAREALKGKSKGVDIKNSDGSRLALRLVFFLSLRSDRTKTKVNLLESSHMPAEHAYVVKHRPGDFISKYAF